MDAWNLSDCPLQVKGTKVKPSVGLAMQHSPGPNFLCSPAMCTAESGTNVKPSVGLAVQHSPSPNSLSSPMTWRAGEWHQDEGLCGLGGPDDYHVPAGGRALQHPAADGHAVGRHGAGGGHWENSGEGAPGGPCASSRGSCLWKALAGPELCILLFASSSGYCALMHEVHQVSVHNSTGTWVLDKF